MLKSPNCIPPSPEGPGLLRGVEADGDSRSSGEMLSALSRRHTEGSRGILSAVSQNIFAPAGERRRKGEGKREEGLRKDFRAESKVNNYNMVSHSSWSAAKGRSPLPVHTRFSFVSRGLSCTATGVVRQLSGTWRKVDWGWGVAGGALGW